MPLPKEQFLPSGAKLDLAKRQAQYFRGGVPEVFKEAAKETYDNPLVNAGIGFAPVLGDLQAAGETVAALRRSAPWQETAGYAAGMLPFVPMIGKTVWHGSPHRFDAFDMSKIGSGEGSQAFGHGLYLAEAPETAKQYQAMANNPAKRQGGLTGEGREQAVLDSLIKLNAKKYTEGDVNKLAELVAQRPAAFTNPEKMIERIGQYEGNAAPSYLYKVDLPDEQIAKMLDWDKPLSEQPKNVQEALAKFDPDMYHVDGGDYDPTELGQMVYSRMSQNPAEASQRMYQAGIPGIQYLDQASRGAGEGTRNYVVFDDQIPQILERNGNPIANALREQPTDYRGHHTAPSPEFGAPLHDLTGGGQMYPEDVYSSNAARFYGHGGDQVAMDRETIKILQALRNQPDAMVDIFRAVPNDDAINAINKGDWVTVNPNYAKTHGDSQLEGNYKVLSQKVPAKSVWTNADSIHEFGYYPE